MSMARRWSQCGVAIAFLKQVQASLLTESVPDCDGHERLEDEEVLAGVVSRCSEGLRDCERDYECALAKAVAQAASPRLIVKEDVVAPEAALFLEK